MCPAKEIYPYRKITPHGPAKMRNLLQPLQSLTDAVQAGESALAGKLAPIAEQAIREILEGLGDAV